MIIVLIAMMIELRNNKGNVALYSCLDPWIGKTVDFLFVCLCICLFVLTDVKLCVPGILRRFIGLRLRLAVDLPQLEVYWISKLSSLDLGHGGLWLSKFTCLWASRLFLNCWWSQPTWAQMVEAGIWAVFKNWVVVNEQDWVELIHLVKHTLAVDGGLIS